MRQRTLTPRQPSRHPAVVLFLAAATLGARTRGGGGSVPLTCPTWEALGEGNAEFGAAIARAGDVDGDGFDDLLVGAPLWDSVTVENEGRAFLFPGSSNGPSTTPSWSAEGETLFAFFGAALGTAGDVNGDGYDDVIVGAHNHDLGRGRAYVYHGAASGLTTSPAWIGSHSTSSDVHFGSAVAGAGDVNGDGYDDVVVGAFAYSNGQPTEGAAYLYLGSASGLDVVPVWSIESDSSGAWLGDAVAGAGDVNDDGYDDWLVGAPLSSAGRSSEGRASLFLGGPGVLSTTPAWSVDGEQAFAQLGSTVLGLDVNGDGFGDVAVASNQFSGDLATEGRVQVFLGSPSGPSSVADWTAEGDEPSAAFGHALAAWDVDGDGFDDLLAGAPRHAFNLGFARLYRGSAAGLATSPAWIALGEQSDSFFGEGLAALDLDADGVGEIAVGAPNFDEPDFNSGRVALYRHAAALDCNANGVADVCDLFAGTSADDDENGVPDECQEIGTRSCSPAVPNSTGQPGVMTVRGSPVVAADDLTLEATQLPITSIIGYFVMGTGSNVATPPGSAGPICVAPGLRRFLPPVSNTAELPGGFTREVGTSGPVSGAITAGSTWGFQAWHRDGMGPSNLTDAVSVVFL